MPRRSELFDHFDEDSLRANYLFMKQAPMYVSLEKKYKDTKKKNRELKRMIDLLNRQNMELMERCASHRYLQTTTECMLSERFSKLETPPKPETVEIEDHSEVELVPVKKENIVYEIIEEEVVDEPETEEVIEEEQETEEVVEESEVVEEEVVEEEQDTEEVVDESEVVEEEEEVVEEEEEEVVEESEVVESEVVEEEEVVVEESEVVEEEQVVEEEEGEELYEITLNGTRYYVSNETDSTIYAVSEDDEVGEEVGSFVDGKPTFQASAEEQEQEEEEEGVYEITINGTRYYVSNETDSTIYAVAEDDEIGDEVGVFVNGVAKLNA
jgi:hypothetical protein